MRFLLGFLLGFCVGALGVAGTIEAFQDGAEDARQTVCATETVDCTR